MANPSRQVLTPTVDGPLPVCKGYQQLDSTALSASSGLTVPSGTTLALIQAEAISVRFRADGTDPTSSVGMLISAGGEVLYPASAPPSGNTIIDLSLAVMNFTEVATQSRVAIALSLRAMASWVAQAITWSNSALGTVIDLTLASLGILASALQTATRTTATLASLTFLGKALQPKVAVSLALKAMSSWLPKALQPKVAVSLALRAMASWLPKAPPKRGLVPP